jgi:hypothetical protein
MRRYFDCSPREAIRRVAVFAFIGSVIYVPAIVTFAILISGNA